MSTMCASIATPFHATTGIQRLTSTAAAVGVPVSHKHQHPVKAVKRTRCISIQAAANQEAEESASMSRRAAVSTMGAALALAPVLGPSVPVASAEEPYITAASGLKYYDVVEGTGVAHVQGETVSIHYVGKNAASGREFTSTRDKNINNIGKPYTFKVGMKKVIKGMDEGVLGGEGIPPMKVGGVRKLYVPQELGFGKRAFTGYYTEDANDLLPAYSDLLFEIELLK